MTIEADLYYIQRSGLEPLLKSTSIEASRSKKLGRPCPARVLVICDQDGNGGAIIIQNPEEHIGVTFYENEEAEGISIDPKKPIRLRRGQEAVIWSEKSRKELNIYIEAEDKDMSPIEPPYISADF